MIAPGPDAVAFAGTHPLGELKGGRRQVHLLGFMGSGKSTVGQLLAKQLVWNYLDLDALVVRHAGQSIAEVFATAGEAEFRKQESWVLRQAVQKPNTVVALGGGTTSDPSNRALCDRVAVTVWLRCPLDVIRARLTDSPGRPLWGGDPVAVEALFVTREAVYEQSRLVVDATQSPGDVATAIREVLTTEC